MKTESFFRAILRVYSEQEQKPANIIGKLIEIVLLEEKESVGIAYIKDKLMEKIGVDFELTRITEGIQKRLRNIEMTIPNDYENSLYSINSKVKKSITDESDDVFIKITSGFKSYSSYDIVPEDFIQLFNRFTYFVFDNTQSQIIKLLNNSYEIKDDTKDFSKLEIMILNQFIKWDNEDKNQFMSKVISYGFEYCMLVTNTQSSELKDIFRKTFFYFDSNIILSTTGIDGEFVKVKTLRFFSKLKDLNSQLLITSETFDEIKSTIDGKIENISYLITTTEEQTINNAKIIFGAYDDSTFSLIGAFFQWSKEYNSRSVNGFKTHIQRKFEETLRDYNIMIDNNRKKIDAKEAIQSLFEYKTDNTKFQVRRTAVVTDAKNLEYVRTLRPATYTSKSQIKHFFVSEDIKLYKWSREYYNDLMPILITPNSLYQFYTRYYAKNSEEDMMGLQDFIKFRKRDYNLEITANEITHIITAVNKITSDEEKAKELMFFVRQDFEETIYKNGGVFVFSDLEEKLKIKYEEIIEKEYNEKFDNYKQTVDKELNLINDQKSSELKSIVNEVLRTMSEIKTEKFRKVFRLFGLVLIPIVYLLFSYLSALTRRGLDIYLKWFKQEAASLAAIAIITALVIPLYMYMLKHHKVRCEILKSKISYMEILKETGK